MKKGVRWRVHALSTLSRTGQAGELPHALVDDRLGDGGAHNGDGDFQPYDAGKVVGDTSPFMAQQ